MTELIKSAETGAATRGSQNVPSPISFKDAIPSFEHTPIGNYGDDPKARVVIEALASQLIARNTNTPQRAVEATPRENTNDKQTSNVSLTRSCINRLMASFKQAEYTEDFRNEDILFKRFGELSLKQLSILLLCREPHTSRSLFEILITDNQSGDAERVFKNVSSTYRTETSRNHGMLESGTHFVPTMGLANLFVTRSAARTGVDGCTILRELGMIAKKHNQLKNWAAVLSQYSREVSGPPTDVISRAVSSFCYRSDPFVNKHDEQIYERFMSMFRDVFLDTLEDTMLFIDTIKEPVVYQGKTFGPAIYAICSSTGPGGKVLLELAEICRDDELAMRKFLELLSVPSNARIPRSESILEEMSNRPPDSHREEIAKVKQEFDLKLMRRRLA